MRRKGVPCGCTDNGGCCGLKEKLAILWERTIGSILKINNQTPDGDGNFAVQGGNNIEVSNVSNGIEIGLKNPLTDDITVQADLTVDGDIVANGDIIQNGQAYETHAEKIYTNDDYIVMREGAIGPLAQGDYSGFQVTKYDGTNDGRLVIDRDGVARVGDVGDEQALATRDESADLTDDHLLKWDATNQKLIDAGIGPDDIGALEFLARGNINVYIGTPYDVETINIVLPSPSQFVNGYDYMVTASVLSASDYSIVRDATISLPRSTINTPDTSFDIEISVGEDVVLYWYVYRTKSVHTGLPNLFGCFPASLETQPKLISGTNIKTVGGQSILGSGNIPAGGLNWTKRTANDDWTDMFDINGYNITAKKHIYIYSISDKLAFYIPKGFTTNTQIKICTAWANVTGNILYTSRTLEMTATRMGSSYSSFNYYTEGAQFTTDGNTVTLTSKATNNSVYKSNLTIYIAD